MRPLAEIHEADLALLAELVGDHPTFRLYLAAGIDAVRAGANNRFAKIGRGREGHPLASCSMTSRREL